MGLGSIASYDVVYLDIEAILMFFIVQRVIDSATAVSLASMCLGYKTSHTVTEYHWSKFAQRQKVL